MKASREVRSSAMAPGSNSVSGVLAVSTSLLNTHMCPATRRRSSPRFRRSRGAMGSSFEMSGLSMTARDEDAGQVYNQCPEHRMQSAHLNPDGTPKYTNRLASETSPYLVKHAHDPVQWYPWGPEALERARSERRPIHLSVGYSSCHWCGVLHQESFEDEGTAEVLNNNFVNIKVDREERPDIDRIYQIAQQMLTQRGGGWPLTMFLTHDDQKPFFGGTYFPKEPRHGLPAFKDLLQRVAAYYREHGPELRKQNEALMTAFDELTP